MANNYTLGRGELLFAQFLPNTQTPGGELYFGNTPEFSASIESEKLEHFNSDRGVREKDASVPLQTNRTGSFTTDNISAENLALFWFGGVSQFAHVGATVSGETILGVKVDRTYPLGQTVANPVGVKSLDEQAPGVNVLVTNTGAVDTYVEGVDYTIDMERARLYIIPGGDILDGSTILVSYKTKTHSFERIISGSDAIEGALRFIAYNPTGVNRDWYMPHVSISPNGDLALKGDDWQVIPFSLEILKKSNAEAVYIDGMPFAA